ncbi:MAG: hypothetical protein UW11_C0009G0009 [Parcubacteria group bacterium GW2011_GWA2_43_9b]|nr:MAG: hypothetical protein UW11_C0009G0009 [Parcubacteria group bacterium GW2011_GWA2_43_9b]
MEAGMRPVCKGSWSCTSLKCRFNHIDATAFCREIPQNGKCSLCGDPIYIFSEDKPSELSFVEIFESRI